MMRIFPIFSILLLAAACTAPATRATPAQAARLADLRVEGPLDEMSPAQIADLEIAAARILARGTEMIAPLAAEIRTCRDPQRRLVLIKILHLAIEDIPSAADREIYQRKVEGAARRLLSSDDASDRYAGLLMIALPQKSRVIPSAVNMLADPDEANRSFAIGVLQQVAGRDFGFRADGTPAERKAAVDRWKRWWRENRGRELYYQPPANPILMGFRAETNRITSTAGPYAVEVRDGEGEALGGVIVAYSYSFTTPDGIGKIIKGRETTDEDGRALTGGERVVSGFQYLGAQLIVSKIGYVRSTRQVLPRFLTPNSFAIEFTIEKE